MLDVSDLSTIEEVGGVELSASEDSVQSLANLATKDGLITLAGINSGSTDRQADKNEHLRSFTVTFPTKSRTSTKKEKNAPGKIVFAGRTSVFQPSTAFRKETYQRLLRLSPVKKSDEGSKRLGVIATGFAPESEVIVFDATTSLPDRKSICAHFKLEAGDEANELDIIEADDGRFALVYCTDSEIFLYKFRYDFSTKKVSDAYDNPFPIRSLVPLHASVRPKFRCVRWLSSGYVLALQNLSGKAGSDLIVLRLATDGHQAFATVRKRFPHSALDMSVCALDADPSGHRQILVAVAMQNIAIHIFTLDFDPLESNMEKQMGRKFREYTVLKDVHPLQISKITFANFFPPKQNKSSTKSVATTPAYIKLASVSVGNTVVVDTFTLTSTPCPPRLTRDASAEVEKEPNVRWVLSTGGTEFLRSWAGSVTVAFVVLVSAYLLQAYLQSRGEDPLAALRPGGRDYSWLPPGAVPPAMRTGLSSASSAAGSAGAAVVPSASSAAAQVADAVSGAPSAVISSAGASAVSAAAAATRAAKQKLPSLRELLALRRDGDTQEILVSEEGSGGGVSVAGHGAETGAELARGGARRYSELTEGERGRWRARLEEAGHWGAGEGEKVLKSVLFAQYAQVVGGGIRDALLNR